MGGRDEVMEGERKELILFEMKGGREEWRRGGRDGRRQGRREDGRNEGREIGRKKGVRKCKLGITVYNR